MILNYEIINNIVMFIYFFKKTKYRNSKGLFGTMPPTCLPTMINVPLPP